MCYFRIDNSYRLKDIQGTSKKHDLGISEGFFSKLPTSNAVSFKKGIHEIRGGSFGRQRDPEEFTGRGEKREFRPLRG